MAATTAAATAERLRRCDTCVLSDALSAADVTGAVLRLEPIGPAARVAGPVRTVQLGPAVPGVVPDRHLGTTAIEAAAPGEIVLVAHPATDEAAGWGGLLALAAQQRGIAAVVVDGVCRDADDYVRTAFPVWAGGVTPRSARGRVVEVATDVEVQAGGARVVPGDWLVADRSGVVVIPAAALDRVLAAAERLLAIEEAMAADLRAGAPVTQVLDTRYEHMVTAHQPQH